MPDVRLIDANALKANFDDLMVFGVVDTEGKIIPVVSYRDIAELIDWMPTIDAQSVKRGHWNRDEMGYDSYVLCSECGLNLNVSDYEKDEWREILRFCPCCGADMRGKANDG